MQTFEEVQYFRQRWMWLLIMTICAAQISGALLIVLLPIFRPQAFPADPQAIYVGAGALFFTAFLVPLLTWKMNLTTRVTGDGIELRFAPFPRRVIPLGEISKVYARQYRPIREYGGWGIKGTFKNRAYNVSGDRGVQLELVNGKRLLIGSQRSEELERVIEARRQQLHH
jgi:hypothetical protein